MKSSQVIAVGSALLLLIWAGRVRPEPDDRGSRAVAGAGSGLQAAVADGFWIAAQVAWDVRDLDRTARMLEFAVRTDPRQMTLAVQAARIVAFDFAAWRIEQARADGRSSPAVERRIAHEQGTLALRVLAWSQQANPDRAAPWVERAALELAVWRDLRAAAESYRRAWRCADGPYFAARIHAELLCRLGERERALAWLRTLEPRLPTSDPSAGAGRVRQRIQELERALAPSEIETPGAGARRL